MAAEDAGLVFVGHVRDRFHQHILVGVRAVAGDALHVAEREVDREILEGIEAASGRDAYLVHAGRLGIQVVALDG